MRERLREGFGIYLSVEGDHLLNPSPILHIHHHPNSLAMSSQKVVPGISSPKPLSTLNLSSRLLEDDEGVMGDSPPDVEL